MRTLNLASSKDGVLAVDQINERDYRNAHGLNKSLLVKFMKSPRHYLAALNEKHEPTDSMRMGTALHAMLFRDDPKKHFAVKKKMDGRTADGKKYNAEFEASAGDKTVLTEEQHETAKGMFESLMKNPRFRKMHDATTHREMGIFSDYKNLEHSCRIKGMLDGYNEHDGIVYDVKSTQDAHMSSFKWDFKKYQYDIQQVHYTRLVMDAGLPFKEFMFVAVENKPPYEVAFYTLSVDSYLSSKTVWNIAMDSFAYCNAKQDFDIGYGCGTNELTY